MGPCTRSAGRNLAASQQAVTLPAQQDSTTPNPQHLDQLSAKDQSKFLQKELNSCMRERLMLKAQLEN